jgi:hypothetical protein
MLLKYKTQWRVFSVLFRLFYQDIDFAKHSFLSLLALEDTVLLLLLEILRSLFCLFHFFLVSLIYNKRHICLLHTFMDYYIFMHNKPR